MRVDAATMLQLVLLQWAVAAALHSPADAMCLIVSINTTMMFFVGDTVFYWKTSVPGVPEARLLPCGLLQSTAHQAVSNDAAGVSWIITIA